MNGYHGFDELLGSTPGIQREFKIDVGRIPKRKNPRLWCSHSEKLIAAVYQNLLQVLTIFRPARFAALANGRLLAFIVCFRRSLDISPTSAIRAEMTRSNGILNELELARVPATLFLKTPTAIDLPSMARLFVDNFPSHPVCALSPRLRHKFIAVHIEEGVALAAADPSTGRVIGFAIGGRNEQLERARRAFIYGNVIPLALHRLSHRERGLRLPSRAARRERTSPSAGHELRYMAIAAGFRCRGIGSALLVAMEREMLLDQPYYVWVRAEREGAMQFCLRHGFREEDRSNGHVRMVKAGLPR